MKPSYLVVIGFLFANFLTATTFDHYTTQSGQMDYSTVQYGNLSVSVTSENLPGSSYAPYVSGQVGYHDTLEIFGNVSGSAGILDIVYDEANLGSASPNGGAGGQFQATSLTGGSLGQFFPVITLPGKIPFQYAVPFALDAQISESAIDSGGEAVLSIKSFTVEGSTPFFWTASSGTQYPFTNGQFTPTPEPSTLAMMLFAASIAGLILYRRSFRRMRQSQSGA